MVPRGFVPEDEDRSCCVVRVRGGIMICVVGDHFFFAIKQIVGDVGDQAIHHLDVVTSIQFLDVVTQSIIWT